MKLLVRIFVIGLILGVEFVDFENPLASMWKLYKNRELNKLLPLFVQIYLLLLMSYLFDRFFFFFCNKGWGYIIFIECTV